MLLFNLWIWVARTTVVCFAFVAVILSGSVLFLCFNYFDGIYHNDNPDSLLSAWTMFTHTLLFGRR